MLSLEIACSILHFHDLSSLTEHRRTLEFNDSYRPMETLWRHIALGDSIVAELRKEALKLECPTLGDAQTMIYGKLRGQIQPRTETPYTWNAMSTKESKHLSLQGAWGMTSDKEKTAQLPSQKLR